MPMALTEWGEKKDQKAVGLLDTGSASTLDRRMFDLLDKGTDKEYPSNADISSIDQNEIECFRKDTYQNEDH